MNLMLYVCYWWNETVGCGSLGLCKPSVLPAWPFSFLWCFRVGNNWGDYNRKLAWPGLIFFLIMICRRTGWICWTEAGIIAIMLAPRGAAFSSGALGVCSLLPTPALHHSHVVTTRALSLANLDTGNLTKMRVLQVLCWLGQQAHAYLWPTWSFDFFFSFF